MGNNKKASRSSRGRSNYAKTMQRGYGKQKRIRKGDMPEVQQPKHIDDILSLMMKGVITGGIAGFFVGNVMGNMLLWTTIGIIAGGALGCIADLIKVKMNKRKANKNK